MDGLVMDHINHDGAVHRRAENINHRNAATNSGTTIYEVLKRKGKIDGLQVLCANCNMIKQLRYGRRKTIKDPLLLAKVEQFCGYTSE